MRVKLILLITIVAVLLCGCSILESDEDCSNDVDGQGGQSYAAYISKTMMSIWNDFTTNPIENIKYYDPRESFRRGNTGVEQVALEIWECFVCRDAQGLYALFSSAEKSAMEEEEFLLQIQDGFDYMGDAIESDYVYKQWGGSQGYGYGALEYFYTCFSYDDIYDSTGQQYAICVDLLYLYKEDASCEGIGDIYIYRGEMGCDDYVRIGDAEYLPIH